jgi:hypothetical protein
MSFKLSRTLYGQVKYGPLKNFVPSKELKPNVNTNEINSIHKKEIVSLLVDDVIEGKALEQLKQRHIWAIENGYQY